MTRFARSLLFALAAGALACASAETRGPAPDGRLELVVLGTTDVHGWLYPHDYYTGREVNHGLARVATLVDSIRAAEPHVLLLDSGDHLQGNSLTTYYGVVAPPDTHPSIRVLNLLRYDAVTLGNHEFNLGLDALDRTLEEATFPLLAGNVFVAGTDSLRWPAWTLVERGGVRIAVLGFTTPGAAVWDRHHLEGRLEFRDLVESARRAWAEAEAASDVQIAIIHSGMGPGSSYDPGTTGAAEENAGRALAEALPGLELILLGHTHREVASTTVGDVLVAQAGPYGRSLAVARIGLAREGSGWRVEERSSTVIPAAGVPPEPAFLASLRPYHERVMAWTADTVGWTPARWSAAAARLADTPILDLVQRVQLDATGADLSTTASFRTAARFGPGPITQGDVDGLYIYHNTLAAVRVTGRQLRDYLEYSAKYFHRVTPEGEHGPDGDPAEQAGIYLTDPTADDLFVDSVPGYNYDVVEGVDYAIDLTRPVGQRIVDLTYRGAPVRDDQTFTLAINNYRMNGGGAFTMLHDAPVVYDRGETVRQLLVDWIAARDSIRPDQVFRPSWRLLPEAAASRALADTAPWAPAPAAMSADTGESVFAHLPPARNDADTVRIAFLATNDIHGALEPSAPAWARGDTVGGVAVLAGTIRAIEDRYPGAVVWLDGGDVMQGTLISNLTLGRSTIEALNAMGLDAAAIGNHEFDWTVDTLQARMADAAFPWLSANIFEKATGERPAWARPYAWIERAGLKIAVIGASTVSTPFTTMPGNVAPYEFRDIAEVVDELAPELEEQGADLVVVAAHAGAIADSAGVYHGEIVEAAEGIDARVDLIVSGHTHTEVNTVVEGIPIVQARANSTALGVVVLTYDRKKREVVDHAIEVLTTYAKNVQPDSAIAGIVARHRETVREIAERPIATLGQPIERQREEESVLGSLIADAQRWATGSQVAIMNAGGIRADLDAGPVSFEEVFRVQPFENLLVRMRVAGEQLRWALEAAVANRLGQVSGVRYTFDPTRPAGERVREATLEDGTPVVRDGRAVDPDATYTLVMNNFMVNRGDTYGMIPGEFEAENTGLVDSEILADYLKQLPQPVRYELPGRVTRLAPWPPRGED